MTKCPKCRGDRRILGLGHIWRTCGYCNGRGEVVGEIPSREEIKAEIMKEHAASYEEDVIAAEKQIEAEEKPKRKRGRPKKVSAEQSS